VEQKKDFNTDEISEMLVKIDSFSGIGLHLDLTLRQIQEAYLQCFQDLGVDLTIEQWVILHKIARSPGGGAQSDIAKTNFRNRATTSRIISVMERKNLIVKSRFPGDKKRYKLNLTDFGQAVFDKTMPHTSLLRNQAINGLSLHEFSTFLIVLDKIKNNYNLKGH
jgi:DNA-binding MarR family transcriptional regulator